MNPAGFSYVLGQEHIVRQMRRAISAGHVSHAYILEGGRGVGKKTLARAFAKALQCEILQDDACGQWLSCRVFESGNHPDIHYASGTNASSIGVDDVREQIVRPMGVKPFRYRYKIFIVDNAETLTVKAQNALLKTVEEPAPYGVFIFLAANINGILPTVLSRCVVYKLNGLPDKVILQALAGAGVSDGNTRRLCAAFAGGSIGQALEFAGSEDFTAMRELAIDIIRRFGQADMLDVFRLYRRFETWKDSIHRLLDMLYLCCRDCIVQQCVNSWRAESGADQETYMADIAEITAGTQLKALYRGVDAIARARKALLENASFQLSIELMLMRMYGFHE